MFRWRERRCQRLQHQYNRQSSTLVGGPDGSTNEIRYRIVVESRLHSDGSQKTEGTDRIMEAQDAESLYNQRFFIAVVKVTVELGPDARHSVRNTEGGTEALALDHARVCL